MSRPLGDPAALAAYSQTLRVLAGRVRDAAAQLMAPTAHSGLSGPAGRRIEANGARLSHLLGARAEELELLAADTAAASHRLADAQHAWDRHEAARQREAQQWRQCL